MLLITVTFLQDGTETREVYNPPAPLLLHVYTVAHFLLSLALLDTLATSFQAGFPGSIVLEDFFLSKAICYPNLGCNFRKPHHSPDLPIPK
jgi:hypothetical protein